VLRVSFIDVGQGDAALLEFPGGETMLVDAGPASPSFDAGEKTVVPYLKRKGIIRLDMLVATHPHNDHIGGIPAVMEECDVFHVIDPGRIVESSVSLRFEEALNNERCRRSHARTGMLSGQLQSARIYVLGPDEVSAGAGNLNNSSVVFKLVYGSVSFLFTGDAEKESEERMVRRYGDFLKSTVLKVGHHGSRTSSSGIFLDFVNPEIAVVSVGTRNRYRHPSRETMQELALRDVVTLRTDTEGAVILETDGRNVEKVVWRGEDD
jgi:competence protein ComEC